MIQCKDCKFYNSFGFDYEGWCNITLPMWLATVVLAEETNRIVSPDAGCDLGSHYLKEAGK